MKALGAIVRGGVLPLALYLAVAGHVPARTPAARDAATPAPLPAGYRLYRSKVLPYTIRYPAGWKADGSIWAGVHPLDYYDADLFVAPDHRGQVAVWGEALPPGSQLTSTAYREALILEEYRVHEARRRQHQADVTTVTRLGSVTIDGRRAWRLRVLQGTSTRDQVETLLVLWVKRGRGWRIELNALPQELYRYVPAFTAMLPTFHMR